MSLAFITHSACLLHEMGEDHPESPMRLHAISDQLIRSGLDIVLRHYDAPAATRDQLELIHTPNYIDSIYTTAPEQGLVSLDPDTTMNKHTLTAALHAAGSGILAVDLLLNQTHQHAFCSVRPPGHHAEPDRAMGFCIFNNIAIAAAYALQQLAIKKVAIVDFDVHQGNGTEKAFSANPNVLYCSIFQHPFYPFTGMHNSQPNIINIPLSAGSGSQQFRDAITDRWLPALNDFQPDILFISAGFDAHREDQMAQLSLTETDYSWVTKQLKKAAKSSAQNRIISMLEGGYNLSALGRSVVAHLKALL